MPYYTTAVTTDLGVLRAVREAAPRVPDIAASYFGKVVQPAIQRRVDVLLGVEPPRKNIPFEFSTPKSRRYYFWLVNTGKVPTDPVTKRYARQHTLVKSWKAKIDRRSLDNFLAVFNTDPASGYVYGPGNALSSVRQVPGHAQTEWGQDFGAKFDEISEYSINQVMDAWNVIIEAILDRKPI